MNQVINFLFRSKNNPGPANTRDLLATNIQRGRDHGIPGYISYFERCNKKLRNIKIDFNILRTWVSQEVNIFLLTSFEHFSRKSHLLSLAFLSDSLWCNNGRFCKTKLPQFFIKKIRLESRPFTTFLLFVILSLIFDVIAVTSKPLSRIVYFQNYEKLIKIYKSVEDIDFYVGMIMEHPKRRSLVGNTIGCILADQFIRLKKADRYFYEMGPGISPYPFTKSNSIKSDTKHSSTYLHLCTFRSIINDKINDHGKRFMYDLRHRRFNITCFWIT